MAAVLLCSHLPGQRRLSNHPVINSPCMTSGTLCRQTCSACGNHVCRFGDPIKSCSIPPCLQPGPPVCPSLPEQHDARQLDGAHKNISASNCIRHNPESIRHNTIFATDDKLGNGHADTASGMIVTEVGARRLYRHTSTSFSLSNRASLSGCVGFASGQTATCVQQHVMPICKTPL